MKLAREPSEAADLVQETLCRAWAKWSNFDEAGNLGAYLSRILFNLFVSRHRHRQVVYSTTERFDLTDHMFNGHRIEEAQGPEQAWHRETLSDEVLAALDELPPHYRCVVELVDLQGVAYREAAETLDVPLGTVMSRLHRARRQMKSSLTDYAQTYGLALA